MEYRRQIHSFQPLHISVSGPGGSIHLERGLGPFHTAGSKLWAGGPGSRTFEFTETPESILSYFQVLGDKAGFFKLEQEYRSLQAPNGYSVLSWDGAHFDVLKSGLGQMAMLAYKTDPISDADALDKITRYALIGRGAFIAPDYSVVPTGRDLTDSACSGCPRCGAVRGQSPETPHPAGTWVA